MIKIADKIYWNGIMGWDIKKFHGHEYSTHRGTTFNSYLIKDEKTVLVDTVWDRYTEDFLDRLDKEAGIENIDLIVINHMEPDHGGSLGEIMSRIPDTPVYCTKNGRETIFRHYHKDWDFQAVKTGDTVNIGEYELEFVEMKMLHWPDSMLTYVKGPGIVFSNDAFGQHYSTGTLFNDEADTCELYQEAIRYYANILAPFSPLVRKKIEQIQGLGLTISMIAPSHGVIWRKDPMQIVDKYYEWAGDYSEDFAVIIYDTMYESTAKMAHRIAEGMKKGGLRCKLYNCSVTSHTDLLTEIFRCRAVVIGSCTVNNTFLRPVAALLSDMEGLKMKGKPAAAFGSYGWSGEAPVKISERLDSMGMKKVQEPLRVKYRPDSEDLEKCVEFGRRFSAQT